MSAALDESVAGSLRRATAGRHVLLESFLKLDPALELSGYIKALRGFELFLSNWEPRVQARLPPRLHDWSAAQSRYEFVVRDLAQLGCESGCRSDVSAECALLVENIRLNDTAAVFGSMYVLEGSALGGQVIARRAREAFGLNPDNGAAYFNGFHSETASRWRQFQHLLAQEVGSTSDARKDACTAARQTFDALLGTFVSLRRDPACS